MSLCQPAAKDNSGSKEGQSNMTPFSLMVGVVHRLEREVYMVWISCIKNKTDIVTIVSKPQGMARMSESKYVYRNRIHIFEMRRTQHVTECNMWICIYKVLCMRVCMWAASLGVFFLCLFKTHPALTAPAATQTRQNKASSDSSVSGTAVRPR